MIKNSGVVKAGAFILALGAHGAAAISLNDDTAIEIEANAGATEAALGSSFADMAAGTLAPQVPLEKTTNAKPVNTEKPRPPQMTASAKPDVLTPPPVQKLQSAEETEKHATTVAPTQRLQPTTTQETTTASLAQTEPMQPQMPTAVAVVQTRTSITPQTQTAPLETVRSQDPAKNSSPTHSARPKVRTPEVEKHAAAAKPKLTAGNAKKSAKKGSATGTKRAKAAKTGSSGKARQAGNAAASNYPGRVMARLSRVPHPSVSARGTARVRFTIASNGRVSSASISRSSGNRRLDHAAVDMIYRAQPYPKPPPGARKSFSINIAGR